MKQLRHDPIGLCTQTNRDFGHYARIRVFPGFYIYLLTHPEAVEHVLLKNHRNYRKPSLFVRPISLLAGNGLLTSEGDLWLRQRRLMQPAFHRQHLAKLAPLMVAAAESFIRDQETTGTGQPFDMLDQMIRLTLRIAGITLFSTDISGESDVVGRAYRVALEHIGHRMHSVFPLPTWLPTPGNLAFARTRRFLDRMVLGLIEARRHAETRPDDLLSLLLAAQDEDTGLGMTDQQLKDEALTLLTAGHETTAAALAWTWYLLAQHPAVQNDLFDEVLGKLQGRSPTLEDLSALPLTRAIFEESMRLYPPAGGLPRKAMQPDEVNGFPIPAKATVVLSQLITHRHPDFWDDPHQFKPERFLPGQATNRHKFAYFPFGGGPRVCIGNTFALMEGPLVLATIIQKFRVDLVPGHPVVPDPTFTLRPKYGVKVRLLPR